MARRLMFRQLGDAWSRIGRLSRLAGLMFLAGQLAWAISPPGASLPLPGRYTLLTPPSRLTIHLAKAGWFSSLGENHIIIARQMQGQASLAGGASNWTGFLALPAIALRVADPHSSSRDRAEVQATMDGPGQLDIARFPRIVWRLAALAPGNPAGTPLLLTLRGQFTLHGVTRPETWRTHWAQRGRRIHMWGRTVLRLTDFGIRPIRRGLGAVRVKDQFELVWDIWWERALAPAQPEPKL